MGRRFGLAANKIVGTGQAIQRHVTSETEMPLLLSRDELIPLLDLPKAIELIEDAHRQQAKGQIVPHAPYNITVGPSTMDCASFPARVLEPRARRRATRGRTAVWAAAIRCMRRCSMPIPASCYRSWDFHSARCELRRWSPSRPSIWRAKIRRSSGLFGVGRNAFGIIKGLQSVRPIKEIFVSSRDPERRKKFCAAR